VSLPAPRRRGTPGHLYEPDFVRPAEREEILSFLALLRPLWEERYARSSALAARAQRRLLRPVYWLGSWQFACLDYYRPPAGTLDRAIRAEPFPPVLARQVARIERIARRMFTGDDKPAGWHLNTCLINLYGSITAGKRAIDTARVGEHRDFEPGPVASISLGERALFQFVTRGRRREPSAVVAQRWLDDGSLLIFGGPTWKERTLHRVQRVDRRRGERFAIPIEGFEARRVNFTLRYVPDAHVTPFARLADQARRDVQCYVEELARHSEFFRAELAGYASIRTT